VVAEVVETIVSAMAVTTVSVMAIIVTVLNANLQWRAKKPSIVFSIYSIDKYKKT
jgi:hypothetical protein